MVWYRTTWQRKFVLERAPYMTAREITDAYWEIGHQITEGAVRDQLRRAGVKPKQSDYHVKKRPPTPSDRAHRYWSQKETDDLEDLWMRGLSFTECGIELGRTRGSVAGKLDRLGLLGERVA